MPPTHLTRVDLPAPLSPTRAVTSPAFAVRSTSRRTWTAPKLLLIPRISRRGAAAVTVAPRGCRKDAGPGAGRVSHGAGTGSHGVPRQLMPAAVHLAAYAPAHRSALVTKPSATTSLTLSL